MITTCIATSTRIARSATIHGIYLLLRVQTFNESFFIFIIITHITTTIGPIASKYMSRLVVAVGIALCVQFTLYSKQQWTYKLFGSCYTFGEFLLDALFGLRRCRRERWCRTSWGIMSFTTPTNTTTTTIIIITISVLASIVFAIVHIW